MPMGEFDRLILGALTDQLLTPERLPTLLRAAQKHRHALASGNVQRRYTLRKQEGELHRKIQNLYAALAEGTAGDTALFREACTVSKASAKKLSAYSVCSTSRLRLSAASLPKPRRRRLPQSSNPAS
jgi:hypothetical protein